MPKYRKKPVVIEAVQFFTGYKNTVNEVIKFVGGKAKLCKDFLDGGYWLEIKTLEGIMTANSGDWIIKGVNGKFYPVKNDIFKETYESVDISNGDTV